MSHIFKNTFLLSLTIRRFPQTVEDPEERGFPRARVSHHQEVCTLVNPETQILHQQLLGDRRRKGQTVQYDSSITWRGRAFSIPTRQTEVTLPAVPVNGYATRHPIILYLSRFPISVEIQSSSHCSLLIFFITSCSSPILHKTQNSNCDKTKSLKVTTKFQK